MLLIAGIVIWAWVGDPHPDSRASRAADHQRPVRARQSTLYTGVALLVLPWLGFLLHTWLGAAIGLILYGASRGYAPAEEAELPHIFGFAWQR